MFLVHSLTQSMCWLVCDEMRKEQEKEEDEHNLDDDDDAG